MWISKSLTEPTYPTNRTEHTAQAAQAAQAKQTAQQSLFFEPRTQETPAAPPTSRTTPHHRTWFQTTGRVFRTKGRQRLHAVFLRSWREGLFQRHPPPHVLQRFRGFRVLVHAPLQNMLFETKDQVKIFWSIDVCVEQWTKETIKNTHLHLLQFVLQDRGPVSDGLPVDDGQVPMQRQTAQAQHVSSPK